MRKIFLAVAILAVTACGPVKVQLVQDEQALGNVVDNNGKVLNEAIGNLNAVIKILQEKGIVPTPKPEEKK